LLKRVDGLRLVQAFSPSKNLHRCLYVIAAHFNLFPLICATSCIVHRIETKVPNTQFPELRAKHCKISGQWFAPSAPARTFGGPQNNSLAQQIFREW
jgi:hypothetical protein